MELRASGVISASKKLLMTVFDSFTVSPQDRAVKELLKRWLTYKPYEEYLIREEVQCFIGMYLYTNLFIRICMYISGCVSIDRAIFLSQRHVIIFSLTIYHNKFETHNFQQKQQTQQTIIYITTASIHFCYHIDNNHNNNENIKDGDLYRRFLQNNRNYGRKHS